MVKKKSIGIFAVMIVAALAFMMVGCSTEESSTSEENNTSATETAEEQTTVTTNTSADTSDDSPVYKTDTSNDSKVPDNNVSIEEYEKIVQGGEEGALTVAKTAIEANPISYEELYESIADGGFTEEEAQYAVDNCGADWNEQAALAAQTFLDVYDDYSRLSIVEKLKQVGFTEEEAEYGATAAGL